MSVEYDISPMYKIRYARTAEDAAFIDACATAPSETPRISGENIVGLTNHYLWLRSEFFPEEIHDEAFYERKHAPEARDKDAWFSQQDSFDALGEIWIDKVTGQDVAVICHGMIKMTGSVGQRYGINYNNHPHLLNKWLKKTCIQGVHPDHRGNRHMALIHRINSHWRATKFPDMKQMGHMHIDNAWDLANTPETRIRDLTHIRNPDGTTTSKTYVQLVHEIGGGKESFINEMVKRETGYSMKDIEPTFDQMCWIIPTLADERGGANFSWGITSAWSTVQKNAWKAKAQEIVPADVFPVFNEHYAGFLEDMTQMGRRSSDNKICLYPDTDKEMSIKRLYSRIISDLEWVESNFV